MSLEVTGKVIKILPAQSGVSQRGEWKKQEFVIETIEQYPKKICISAWAERVDDIQNLEPGTQLKVAVNIESREYNERWYTDVRAWKIELLSAGTDISHSPDSFDTQSVNQESPVNSDASNGDEDLPF